MAELIKINSSQKEFSEIIRKALLPTTTAINDLNQRFEKLNQEIQELREQEKNNSETFLTLQEALLFMKMKDTAFRRLLVEFGYFKTDSGYYRRSDLIKMQAGIKNQ